MIPLSFWRNWDGEGDPFGGEGALEQTLGLVDPHGLADFCDAHSTRAANNSRSTFIDSSSALCARVRN